MLHRRRPAPARSEAAGRRPGTRYLDLLRRTGGSRIDLPVASAVSALSLASIAKAQDRTPAPKPAADASTDQADIVVTGSQRRTTFREPIIAPGAMSSNTGTQTRHRDVRLIWLLTMTPSVSRLLRRLRWRHRPVDRARRQRPARRPRPIAKPQGWSHPYRPQPTGRPSGR
jgi:hypothetical protein